MEEKLLIITHLKMDCVSSHHIVNSTPKKKNSEDTLFQYLKTIL